MFRPVSELADMETRMGLAGLNVDPVFQHSRRWGLLKRLLKTLVSFSLPRRLGLRGSLLMRVQATDIFFRPPSGPLLTGEGLCHVECQGTPEDAQNWFVGSADVKNAFHQMRIPGWLQSFFCTSGSPRIRSWLHGEKSIDQKRLAPDSLSCPVPTTLPTVFAWAKCFCQDVTDHCTLAGCADSRDQSTLPLLGGKHGVGSIGFRWSYADNFGFLARGANCTDVHLARLNAGVQKAGPDVHDTSRASGNADVLGYEVSPVNAERAHGHHVFAHPHVLSLRAVVSAVGISSSSMVTILSRRSAIVGSLNP